MGWNIFKLVRECYPGRYNKVRIEPVRRTINIQFGPETRPETPQAIKDKTLPSEQCRDPPIKVDPISKIVENRVAVIQVKPAEHRQLACLKASSSDEEPDMERRFVLYRPRGTKGPRQTPLPSMVEALRGQSLNKTLERHQSPIETPASLAVANKDDESSEYSSQVDVVPAEKLAKSITPEEDGVPMEKETRVDRIRPKAAKGTRGAPISSSSAGSSMMMDTRNARVRPKAARGPRTIPACMKTAEHDEHSLTVDTGDVFSRPPATRCPRRRSDSPIFAAIEGRSSWSRYYKEDRGKEPGYKQTWADQVYNTYLLPGQCSPSLKIREEERVQQDDALEAWARRVSEKE